MADHCIKFALSDVKDTSFKRDCDHKHIVVCDRCEELKDAIKRVENIAKETIFSSADEQDDMIYRIGHAVQAIQAWKTHQLRSVNQERAREEAIDRINEHTVLLTQDWAMKFVPQSHRESQTDWFGKRGISWHITVVARKKKGIVESQSFVHIVQNCTQDSSAVISIMEHILMTLKAENSEISVALYRQDNAGCYHNASMIFASKCLSERTGIQIQRVDFSDPQGGKGPCDRLSATVKSHVRIFIDEGNDVLDGAQFERAMLANGGVPGVRVALVDGIESSLPKAKMMGISFLNDFEFREEGIVAWKAFDVGDGKLIPWSQMDGE